MQIHWNRLISRVRSQARQRSRARRRADSASRAQIQCLDSRVLLSAVTGGTGVFVDSGQDLGEYNSVSLGDVNGDGGIDAFVTNLNAPLNAFKGIALNDGSGDFSAGDNIQIVYSGSVDGTALGDLDGDGDLDAFAIGGSADGRVFINDGFGSFHDSGQFLGTGIRYIGLGDLDGDGDIDALIAHDYASRGTTQVWLNDGTGIFLAGQTLPNSSDGHGIELADFDTDGDLDALIGGNGNFHHIWVNDGDAAFTDMGSVGPAYTRAVVGDVDGDLDVDILFTDTENRTEVWLNDGDAEFSDSGSRLGTGPEIHIALGDLDADGDLDAVLGDFRGADSVWLNNSVGIFTPTGQELGGEGTRDIALADLDGDGDLDLFVPGRSTGTTRVWLNQDQPVADQLDLPDSGGTFEVLVDAGDLVVREQGGNELFRESQDDVPRLQINGSDADDTLIVDFSGGNPIPGSRLEFFAGDQASEDALILGSGSVTSVSHSFSSDSSGNVIVDGAMLLYSGLEPSVTDGLTADRRYFRFGEGGDDITVSDNGSSSDGITRISADSRSLDFVNPAESLQILTGLGDDTLTLASVDSLFAGKVAASLTDGNDLLTAANDFPAIQVSGGPGNDTLIGTMNDDTLTGSAGNDIVNGRGGNDSLGGSTGDDVLLGGAGSDLLDGSDGADRLLGQGGSHDTLSGGDGADMYDGGAGRDWLIDILEEHGTIAVTTGILTDTDLTTAAGVEPVSNIELAELTRSDRGTTTVHDALIDASGFSGPVSLQGGAGDDTLIGSSQDDSLDGGGGDDSLDGGGGHDTVRAGAGNDTLQGGDGHDSLDAGDGSDSLLGGDGNDRLDAGDGDDTLLGGSGDDSLDGGWGNDAIAGQAGNDWLNGRRDDDTILGGDGNDVLLGGGQNDILLGEDGDDLVRGHSGEDTLTGAGMGTTASAADTVMGGTIDDAFTVDISWLTV